MDTTNYLVIKEHCAKHGVVGNVVRVEAVEPAHPLFYLRCECRAKYAHNEPHALIAGHNRYHPMSWLKPLPPVVEDVREDEEITA